MAAVLKDQPKPPRELAPDVPKELERIILRCLRKDPGRRFQSMADVKIELLELKEESDSQASAPAGTATATRRSRRRWMAWSQSRSWSWRRHDPRVVAAAPGEPPADASSSRSRRTGRAGAGTLLAGRHADRVLVAGRDGRQRGHLAEDRRRGRGPAPDDRYRARALARVVAGRQADRLRAGSPPRGTEAASHLVSPLGGSERRLSRLPGAGPALLVPRRALAGRGEGPGEVRGRTRRAASTSSPPGW